MTEATEQLRLDERLCLSVHAAGRAFDALYRELLTPIGLTYPQYLLLTALWQEDSQTPGDLAEALHLDPSSITSLVRRLQERDLLKRERDATDDRRVLIHLTDQGRELERQTEHIVPAICEALDLSPEAQQGLLNEMTHLTTALRERLA